MTKAKKLPKCLRQNINLKFDHPYQKGMHFLVDSREVLSANYEHLLLMRAFNVITGDDRFKLQLVFKVGSDEFTTNLSLPAEWTEENVNEYIKSFVAMVQIIDWAHSDHIKLDQKIKLEEMADEVSNV